MVDERAKEAFYQGEAAQWGSKPRCRRMAGRDKREDQRVLDRDLANLMGKCLKVPLPCFTELLVEIVFQTLQQFSDDALEQVFTP